MVRPLLITCLVVLVAACARDQAVASNDRGDVSPDASEDIDEDMPSLDLDVGTDDTSPSDVPDGASDVPDDSDDAGADVADADDDTPAEVAWWRDDFPFRVPLVLDAPEALDLEPLNNVPISVQIDLGPIGDQLIDNPAIAFTDDDGAVLSVDVEVLNDTSILAWVRLPEVRTSVRFWCYIGSDAAIGRRSPWDDSYELVLHMSETTGMEPDRSPHRRHAEVTQSTRGVGGAVGPGYELESNVDWLAATFDEMEPYSVAEAVTVSAWVRRGGVTGEGIVTRWGEGHDSFALNLADGQDQMIDVEQTVFTVTNNDVDASVWGSTPVPVGQWSWIVAVFDAGEMSVYFNGQLDGTDTAPFTTIDPIDFPVYIGHQHEPEFRNPYIGGLDEVRIENVARSPTWILLQYLSMTNQLVTVGTWQAGP